GSSGPAARGISARRHVQPLVSASRSIQRISPNSECCRACQLGAQRRRTAGVRAKGEVGVVSSRGGTYVSGLFSECSFGDRRSFVRRWGCGGWTSGSSGEAAAGRKRSTKTSEWPNRESGNERKGAIVMATAISKPNQPKVVPPAEWLNARVELL